MRSESLREGSRLVRRAAWHALLAAAAALHAAEPMRLITLDPGHFHAALVQREMLAGVSNEVAVYAPLGPDLIAHLQRIAGFNTRSGNPTAWRTRVYAGPDYMEQLFAREPRDGIVIISGHNRGKIDSVLRLIAGGFHGLIDKPWIIDERDFEKLREALDAAEAKRLVHFDGMTERFEITRLLQRLLVNSEPVFGKPLAGTPGNPSVEMDSVHFLLKLVAGVPALRPPAYFDVAQQGEALADVGTHLVDLVHWTLFPGKVIDYRRDIRLLYASNWPTLITRAQLERVTGERRLPGGLEKAIEADGLHYACNNEIGYSVRGFHVRLKVDWQYEAPAGSGDRVRAVFHGSQASIELLQDKDQSFRPEIYVVPANPGRIASMETALRRTLQAATEWPGLEVKTEGARLHVLIPERYRIGHEAHFSILLNTFLGYVRNPASLPAWEKPNMLAKYYVTTAGVALAHRTSSGKATQ